MDFQGVNRYNHSNYNRNNNNNYMNINYRNNNYQNYNHYNNHNNNRYNTGPVSYTHLDVYKRQVLCDRYDVLIAGEGNCWRQKMHNTRGVFGEQAIIPF